MEGPVALPAYDIPQLGLQLRAVEIVPLGEFRDSPAAPVHWQGFQGGGRGALQRQRDIALLLVTLLLRPPPLRFVGKGQQGRQARRRRRLWYRVVAVAVPCRARERPRARPSGSLQRSGDVPQRAGVTLRQGLLLEAPRLTPWAVAHPHRQPYPLGGRRSVALEGVGDVLEGLSVLPQAVLQAAQERVAVGSLGDLDVLYLADRGETVRNHPWALPREVEILSPAAQVLLEALRQGLVAPVILLLLARREEVHDLALAVAPGAANTLRVPAGRGRRVKTNDQ